MSRVSCSTKSLLAGRLDTGDGCALTEVSANGGGDFGGTIEGLTNVTVTCSPEGSTPHAQGKHFLARHNTY